MSRVREFKYKVKFIRNGDNALTPGPVRTHESISNCVLNHGSVNERPIAGQGRPVTFGDHNYAKILMPHPHHKRNSHFNVTASYNWFQPGVVFKAQTPKSVAHRCGAKNILDLNNDCMLKVFGYLNLAEQIQAARASKRFQAIFVELNLQKFKEIDLYKLDSLKLSEIKDLLKFIGHGAESVITTRRNHREDIIILKIIALLCLNIKQIEFRDEVLNVHILKYFVQNCTEIRKIRIIDGVFIDDEFIKNLKYFRKLESLFIHESYRMTGAHLKELIRLKELRVKDCCSVKSDDIVSAIWQMKDLRILEIDILEDSTLFERITRAARNLDVLHIETDGKGRHDFYNLRCLKEFSVKSTTHDFYNDLKLMENLAYAHWENLRVLSITNMIVESQMTQRIAQLKKIRKLSLYEMNLLCPISNAIREFADLEEMTLAFCENFTKEMLIDILKGCHKLQRVTLFFKVEMIEEIFENIAAIVRQQRENGMRSSELKIIERSHDRSGSTDIKKFTSPGLEAVCSKLKVVNLQVDWGDSVTIFPNIYCVNVCE